MPRSSQSTMRDSVSAPIDQDLVGARTDEAVRRHERVDEAGAGGVEVERTASEPELVLHGRCGRRHGLVGRRGGQHQQVDLRRVDARALERGTAGLDREAAGRAADAALLDAGALGDPLVARVHRRGEVVVRDGLVGERGAPAGDARPAQAPEGGRGGHAVRSHAMGWLTATRSPSTAMSPITEPPNGERTS